jgi:hypothetical protein
LGGNTSKQPDKISIKRKKTRSAPWRHRPQGGAEFVLEGESEEIMSEAEIKEIYDARGNLIIRCWYKDGKLHREDGPAGIQYNKDGHKMGERWYKNGQLHREDSPAEIRYGYNGKIVYEAWAKNGRTHRENGPAIINYWMNGLKSAEIWVYKNKLHRTDGPAVIEYDLYGDIELEEYYVNNIKITKEEFLKYNMINNLLNKVHGKKKITL